MGELGKDYSGLTGKTKKDFGHGESLYVPYKNIFNNHIVDVDNLEKVNVSSKQNKVKYGDIFFTISSEVPEEVGMSSVIGKDINNLYLNSFSFGLRPYEKSELDMIFSSYLFRTLTFRKKMYILAQGISRYNISKANVMKLEIALPSVNEQKKIGRLLYKLDSMITLHKRKLLIYKRLREYYSSLFYSTDRGIIFSNSRDAWKKEKLSKVFYPHKLSDVIFSEEDKDLTGDKLYIITQGDTPIKEITKGTGNQDYEEVIFFGDHTLSLSKINGPYKVDTDGVKVLHVDKDFDRDFIFYLIKCNMPASEGYKRHFTILKNKKVWLTTDIDEQVKISNTLNLLDKLVSSQNNKIEKLQNLRTEYLNTLFI